MLERPSAEYDDWQKRFKKIKEEEITQSHVLTFNAAEGVNYKINIYKTLLILSYVKVGGLLPLLIMPFYKRLHYTY